MTSKRNNNILIRLKIICVIKKRALIFWYYKTTILKKKKKVSQKFLSRQKPISVGSKMISRNSDKFLETPFGRFSKFIGVSRNHFGPTEIGNPSALALGHPPKKSDRAIKCLTIAACVHAKEKLTMWELIFFESNPEWLKKITAR